MSGHYFLKQQSTKILLIKNKLTLKSWLRDYFLINFKKIIKKKKLLGDFGK